MIIKLIFSVALLTVLQQSEANSGNRKHIICYHGTWSTYRNSLGKYDVTDIDPFLCTHLMYAFFGIEENGNLRIIDPYLDLEENWGRGNIRKFNALKLQNPTLKTLIAVGGWNEGSKNFSIVANDAEKRARFVRSVVQFVQRHGFDGLDLDWEYPNQRHHLKPNEDRSNFITLLRELKEGLEPFGYLLTAAVASAEYSASLSYNIPEMIKYLDIINVMAYDLHGPWNDVIGINAPLYAGPNDKTTIEKQLNVDAVVKYWLNAGAPREKLVIGVPFYGRSFTLADPKQHTPGSPHLGRGLAGQYSIEPGVIGYNEICEKLQHEAWTLEWESTQMVPYAYRDRQWFGYETPRSIELKAKYIMDNDLAGIMIWSIESDDFRGMCGNEKYPLLNVINRVFYDGGTATGMTASKPQAPSSALSSSQSSVSQLNENKVKPPNISGRHEFKCQHEAGYVRDTEDCSKFYFCDAGTTFNFQCPAALKFDLTTSNCNYGQSVDC